MREPIALPTPRDQPRDLESYALRGSFAVGDLTVHHLTDGLTFGNRRFWFNGIDPATWMEPLGAVLFVVKVFPQPQVTVVTLYWG